MATTETVRARRPRLGYSTWLRRCDEVSVYTPDLGYVRVTKKTAATLLHKKGDRLTARFVGELGLLLIEPNPPVPLTWETAR